MELRTIVLLLSFLFVFACESEEPEKEKTAEELIAEKFPLFQAGEYEATFTNSNSGSSKVKAIVNVNVEANIISVTWPLFAGVNGFDVVTILKVEGIDEDKLYMNIEGDQITIADEIAESKANGINNNGETYDGYLDVSDQSFTIDIQIKVPGDDQFQTYTLVKE